MQITDVRVRAFSKPFDETVERPDRVIRRRDLLVVEVEAEGATGMGFLTGLNLARGGELHVLAAVVARALRPLLLGEDALATERLWLSLYQATSRFGRRGAVIRSLSAVDIALWDLKARAANLSLHKLLGGYSDRIPAYASGGYVEDLEALAAEVQTYVSSGFDAVKIHIGGGDPEDDVRRVGTVREVIGPKRKLMVDATGHLDVKGTLALIDRLKPFDIFWLEEPLNLDDVAGYHRLAGRCDVRIAAGGGEYLRHGFRPLIETGAVDVVQADASRTGGITEWMKIASFAAAYGLPMAPHAVQEVHQHLVAAVPNGLMLEFFDHEHQIQRFISEAFGRPVNPTAGHVIPPTGPGLGLRLDEAAVEPWAVRLEG